MPFTDTRLGPGTLLLGATPGTEHGFQINAFTITPSVDETDGTPTLAVPEPPPEMKTSFTVDGTAISDFGNATGLQRFAYDNDGTEVHFVFTSSTVAGEGAVVTGDVQMRAFPIGGTVGEQITQDFSWPCIAKPTITSGAAAAAEAKSK